MRHYLLFRNLSVLLVIIHFILSFSTSIRQSFTVNMYVLLILLTSRLQLTQSLLVRWLTHRTNCLKRNILFDFLHFIPYYLHQRIIIFFSVNNNIKEIDATTQSDVTNKTCQSCLKVQSEYSKSKIYMKLILMLKISYNVFLKENYPNVWNLYKIWVWFDRTYAQTEDEAFNVANIIDEDNIGDTHYPDRNDYDSIPDPPPDIPRVTKLVYAFMNVRFRKFRLSGAADEGDITKWFNSIIIINNKIRVEYKDRYYNLQVQSVGAMVKPL